MDESLDEPLLVERPNRGWMLNKSASVGIVLLVGLGMFVGLQSTSSNQKASGFHIPENYSVRANLSLPYSGLVERISVIVEGGMQRISYYEDSNVFINNRSGTSYSIVPRLGDQVCFFDNGKGYNASTQTGGGTPLVDVFPKNFEKHFKKRDQQETVNGVVCTVFEYHVNKSVGDEDGYFGNYTFYVNGNIPVRLALIGHNIVFGGSHVDEYQIDYFEFYTGGETQDPSVFEVPNVEACSDRRGIIEEEKASLFDHNLHLLLPGSETEKAQHFEKHKNKFNQTFGNQESFRSSVFHSNLRHIQATNRLGNSYILAPNHLAHSTEEELAELRGHKPSSTEPYHCHTETNVQIKEEIAANGIPRVVDYVSDGTIGAPGDQATCGSCWSFSAVGALEGAYAKLSGGLQTKVSAQNIMDCSWGGQYKNKACDGGDAPRGFEWAMNNNQGLIATLESYPYLSQDGLCHFDISRELVDNRVDPSPFRVTGCAMVTERFENDTSVSTEDSVSAFMYKLSTVGPLAISINAEPKDFYFYQSGVFTSSKCLGGSQHLDHAVLGVGYNLDADIPYMVMRNSWSTHWGENGFARLALDGNICGFATAPNYPEIELI